MYKNLIYFTRVSDIKRALLIGVDLANNKDFSIDESLEELSQLADTKGAKTIQTIIQKKDKPDHKFFIGKGKVFEIEKICIKENIGIVIFDDNLTPAQQKNLEDIIPAKIIDRTQLILDIFAQRARTQEAKLQIELADKYYQLPRLIGRTGILSQQVGNIGVRGGAGERRIEIDRRRIRDRIAYLKKLPHQLIAAFKSTIEEITHSDLIIHLIDATNPNYRNAEKVVLGVLKDIEADKIPIINVYNKCDLIKNKFYQSNCLCISASKGDKVLDLLNIIDKKLEGNMKYRKLIIPFSKLSIVDRIKSVGRIINYLPYKNFVKLTIMIDEKNWEQTKKKLNLNSKNTR